MQDTTLVGIDFGEACLSSARSEPHGHTDASGKNDAQAIARILRGNLEMYVDQLYLRRDAAPRGLGTLTIGGWCAQRNSPGSSTLGCPPLAGALLGLFLGINAGTGIGFGRH